MYSCDDVQRGPRFFVELVRRGNVELLAKLLAKGYPVNVSVERNWTVLHEAAYRNKLECMKVLISNSSSQINSTNWYNKTPLYLCAKKNHLECLEYLLAKGADPNICDHSGRSPLYLAVANGNIDMVLKLLENDANVRTRGDAVHIPLHKAIELDHPEVVKVLLERGALVINIDNSECLKPLSIAAHGRTDCLKVILKLFDEAMTRSDIALLLNKSWFGGTSLQIAASSGNTDCVKLLLAAGADANVVNDSDEVLPIYMAFFNIHPEVFKILLPLTDQELMYNEYELNPLKIAMRMGKDATIFELCVRHGYPVDRLQEIVPTRTVLTSLFPEILTLKASMLTNAIFMATPKEFFDTILERQTDFNSLEFIEFPPLLAALSKNQLDLASELVNRGASINVYLPSYSFNLSLLATENLESLKFVLKMGAEANSLFLSGSIAILSQVFSETDATIKAHLELMLCHSFYVSEKTVFPREFYTLLSSKTQRMVSEIPSVRSLQELSRRTCRKDILSTKDLLNNLECLRGILPKIIIDFFLFNNM